MKKYKIPLLFIFLGLFLVVNGLQAEKKQTARKENSAPESDVPDFSEGFAKLAKFGLPNVKDAEYIRLDMYSTTVFFHDVFRYRAKVEGNAWLLSEDKKLGKAEIVLNQGAVATVYNQRKLADELTKKLQEKAKKNKEKKSNRVTITFRDVTGGRLAGDWKKANLKKDAKNITEHIRKEMQNDYFWGKDSLGIWLLFAAHLNQKGLKKEANELAAVLFDAGKGKRIVILQALNALADAKYGVAYAVFRGNHDWEKYAEDVADILSLYKRGWKNGPGIKLLEQRLADRKKNIAELKNLKVSQEDAAVIDKIVSGKVGPLPEGLWILNNPEKPEVEDGEDEDDSPISRLAGEGMNAVPLLIKLLGNKTLIPADKGDFSRFSTTTFYSNSSSGTPSAEQIFMRLNRPVTLGEFARAMLDPVVLKEIETDSNGNEITRISAEDDTDDFIEVCRKWYNENKGKSAVELAETYMSEGSRGQKSSAVLYLLNRKVKSEYKLIEKFLLEEGDRNGSNSRFKDHLAILYAGRRGKEARAFAEKYIAMIDPDGDIRKEAKEQKTKPKSEKKKKNSDGATDEMFVDENSDSDGGMDEWKKRQILETIESLKGMTSDESVEDIFNDVLSGKKELTPKLSGLLVGRLNMSDKTVDEKLAFVLKAAVSAAEKKRNELFDSLMRMAVRCRGRKTPDPAKNRELWKKLLQNTSVFGEFKESAPTTIGQVASGYYAAIYGMEDFPSSLLAAGDKIREFLRLRILKKLEGVSDSKLSKIPVFDNLSEKERDAKVKSVVEKVRNSQDKKKCVNSLSLEELIFLKRGLDKDGKLNRELAKIANKVVRVETSMPGAKKFAKFAEKPLSWAMVEELRLFSLDALKKGKKVYCRIYRRPALEGVSIFINEIPEDKLPRELKKSDTKILLSGLLKVLGAFNTRAYWPLEEEKAASKKVSNNEDDDLFGDMEEEIMDESKDFYSRKQENFREKVKLFEAGKLNSLFAGGVYFQGEAE